MSGKAIAEFKDWLNEVEKTHVPIVMDVNHFIQSFAETMNKLTDLMNMMGRTVVANEVRTREFSRTIDSLHAQRRVLEMKLEQLLLKEEPEEPEKKD